MYSRKTGFTLVEIMVASTIGAFIALVAVGTLRAIITSNEMVDKNIKAASEVEFASNMIERDLVNFYRNEKIENTKLIGTVEELGQNITSYLVFYTIGRIKARANEPEGDIYEVEYYLAQDVLSSVGQTSDEQTSGEENPEEAGSMLMRRLWPNPNDELEPGGILTVIAEDIDVFEVRYFDGEEWSDEWPEEMEVLPQLIEVSIVAKLTGKGEPTMASFIVNLTSSAASAVDALAGGMEGESSQQSNTSTETIE